MNQPDFFSTLESTSTVCEETPPAHAPQAVVKARSRRAKAVKPTAAIVTKVALENLLTPLPSNLPHEICAKAFTDSAALVGLATAVKAGLDSAREDSQEICEKVYGFTPPAEDDISKDGRRRKLCTPSPEAAEKMRAGELPHNIVGYIKGFYGLYDKDLLGDVRNPVAHTLSHLMRIRTAAALHLDGVPAARNGAMLHRSITSKSFAYVLGLDQDGEVKKQAKGANGYDPEGEIAVPAVALPIAPVFPAAPQARVAIDAPKRSITERAAEFLSLDPQVAALGDSKLEKFPKPSFLPQEDAF